MKSAPPAGIIGFPGAAVGAIPFVFPFAPLGLGLFDADPQRLLSLLHHQSALAEEALRYRSLLFGGGTTTPDGTPSQHQQPLEDCKEPLNLHATTHASTTATAASYEHDKMAAGSSPTKATMIRVRDGLTKEGFRNGGGEELLLRKPPPPPPPPPATPAASAPSSSAPSPSCDDTGLSLFRDVRQLSGGSPTPTTSTGGGSGSAAAAASGTDTAKCHICMANFPSAWLLEQHSALQHPHLTIHDDKPYLCGLCGQKSRYACCRYRTVLAKHHRGEPGGGGGRSRVPADKLFTCDVCGMQFRYLKSFKKHRLNHALERLHGKKGGGGGVGAPPADSEPAVSSTNEGGGGGEAASSAMVADLRSRTAAGVGDGSEGGGTVEQDDTVSDSALQNQPAADCAPPTAADDTHTKISSSSNSGGGGGGGCSNGSSNSNNSSSSGSSSACSTTATTTTINNSTVCHSNGINASPCSNGGRIGPMVEAASEALLTGELKRYQAASVAAVAAAAAHHHHHQHHAGGGLVHAHAHALSPPGTTTTATSGPASSLSHTLNSLINAETIPHHRLLGLDPQEASILNFLRVDAAEKQRDRRFACPFCGKCVRSKENLKLHVRKHTGERPFVCLFCGRAFGGKSDLTRHLRIHTGERPYHCEACGKCFARADYLSKHLTTHVHQLSPRP
uniref:C2H2-type domain-containing protein n=1 Tax=Anopheles coluzzii TaxID=1518534 RepID=A0A6E8UYN6_ANOCL